MTSVTAKARPYVQKIELLTASPEPEAMEKIAQEARLLLRLLDEAEPTKNQKNKGVNHA